MEFMANDLGIRSLDMIYEWSPEKMVEVELENPDAFLKVRETLTRIGIMSKRPAEDGKYVLTQSAHLLHKRGKYYIVHFKELFFIDGRDADLTIGDIERRNLIVSLLEQWGLVKVVNQKLITIKAPMSAVRVVPYKEKQNYSLVAKYKIGKKK